MYTIRVKTMSGPTYEIPIEGTKTVLDFKNEILAKMNSSDSPPSTTTTIDNMRLIYQGRMLANNKKIEDVRPDLNGNSVHLVNRAPPAVNLSENSSSATETQASNDRRNNNNTTNRSRRSRETSARNTNSSTQNNEQNPFRIPAQSNLNSRPIRNGYPVLSRPIELNSRHTEHPHILNLHDSVRNLEDSLNRIANLEGNSGNSNVSNSNPPAPINPNQNQSSHQVIAESFERLSNMMTNIAPILQNHADFLRRDNYSIDTDSNNFNDANNIHRNHYRIFPSLLQNLVDSFYYAATYRFENFENADQSGSLRLTYDPNFVRMRPGFMPSSAIDPHFISPFSLYQPPGYIQPTFLAGRPATTTTTPNSNPQQPTNQNSSSRIGNIRVAVQVHGGQRPDELFSTSQRFQISIDPITYNAGGTTNVSIHIRNAGNNSENNTDGVRIARTYTNLNNQASVYEASRDSEVILRRVPNVENRIGRAINQQIINRLTGLGIPLRFSDQYRRPHISGPHRSFSFARSRTGSSQRSQGQDDNNSTNNRSQSRESRRSNSSQNRGTATNNNNSDPNIQMTGSVNVITLDENGNSQVNSQNIDLTNMLGGLTNGLGPLGGVINGAINGALNAEGVQDLFGNQGFGQVFGGGSDFAGGINGGTFVFGGNNPMNPNAMSGTPTSNFLNDLKNVNGDNYLADSIPVSFSSTNVTDIFDLLQKSFLMSTKRKDLHEFLKSAMNPRSSLPQILLKLFKQNGKNMKKNIENFVQAIKDSNSIDFCSQNSNSSDDNHGVDKSYKFKWSIKTINQHKEFLQSLCEDINDKEKNIDENKTVTLKINDNLLEKCFENLTSKFDLPSNLQPDNSEATNKKIGICKSNKKFAKWALINLISVFLSDEHEGNEEKFAEVLSELVSKILVIYVRLNDYLLENGRNSLLELWKHSILPHLTSNQQFKTFIDKNLKDMVETISRSSVEQWEWARFLVKKETKEQQKTSTSTSISETKTSTSTTSQPKNSKKRAHDGDDENWTEDVPENWVSTMEADMARLARLNGKKDNSDGPSSSK